MTTKNLFALSALGAMLVAYGIGCGGGGTAGKTASGTAGAAGTAASGTAGDFGGQGTAGDLGGQGTAGVTGQGTAGDNGMAGTAGGGMAGAGGQGGGGMAGRPGRDGGAFDGGFRRDAGGTAGRTGRDGGVNRDAIGGVDLRGFDAGLPDCAAGVMNGGMCTRGTSASCKPAMGNACICRNNNTWACF
jgi:hypothetical protein